MLEVNTAICKMAIKQRFSVSPIQLFKKSTVCYCQIHMCFGLSKHYNQYLSKNQLFSPQLKIQRQGSTFAITDEYTGDHLNGEKKNYFINLDVVNNHIPFVPFNDFLWFRTKILCLNHGPFILYFIFSGLQPMAQTK